MAAAKGGGRTTGPDDADIARAEAKAAGATIEVVNAGDELLNGYCSISMHRLQAPHALVTASRFLLLC